MIFEPVEAAGGRLIGTAVFLCALLMEYFLLTAIFRALGENNDSIFSSNSLLEEPS